MSAKWKEEKLTKPTQQLSGFFPRASGSFTIIRYNETREKIITLNQLFINDNDKIIKHVEILFALYKQQQKLRLQSEIEQLKSRIIHSGEKINEAVYKLYYLSPAEINFLSDRKK